MYSKVNYWKSFAYFCQFCVCKFAISDVLQAMFTPLGKQTTSPLNSIESMVLSLYLHLIHNTDIQKWCLQPYTHNINGPVFPYVVHHFCASIPSGHLKQQLLTKHPISTIITCLLLSNIHVYIVGQPATVSLLKKIQIYQF